MLRTERRPQTYANHRKIIPLFHVVAFFIFVLNLYWAGKGVIEEPTMKSVVSLLFAIALMILLFAARTFPMVVQDRLIRLEMRMRLAEILPNGLKQRIAELTVRQLVALRFASDGEMPELVRNVLDERIENGEVIKRMIKDWQPDYQRC